VRNNEYFDSPERQILPAKLEQPTLVKLGLEKLIKTVIDSKIISNESPKDEISLIQKQNFAHLLNIFNKKNETFDILLNGGPEVIIESDGVSYRQ
jgi:hypothetical protein